MTQQRFWPDPQPLVERLGRSFFRQVPTGPGVYLMHSANGAVLYVGKARNLRHRLGSYRVANPDRLPRRTLRLLRLVERIAWEECPDESAALRREAELLLALKPRFNRAGVWPGPQRFLAWRHLAEGVSLSVTTDLSTGWSWAGPFGGQAFPLQRALVRLLWCRFYPERGLAGMPSGWFYGRHGAGVMIPIAASTVAGEAVAHLTSLFESGSEHFQTWLGSPQSSFDRVCWDEDCSWVADAVTRWRQRSTGTPLTP